MAKKIRRTTKGGYYQNMPHKAYWKQRGKETLAETFATSDEVNAYLTGVYKKCMLEFCGKYNELLKPFVKNGVLDAAALQKAKSSDIGFAAKYMRLLREIDNIKDTLADVQQSEILSLLEDVYKDNVIKNFAELGASTDGIEILNEAAVKMAVKQPFTADGREFSDRIWDNLNIMNGKLRQTLSESITKGESIQKTVSKFKDIFGNSTYNTERIIRTETMAVYAKASRDSYSSLGVKQMEILAEADACDECQAMADKRIDVEDAELGIDIPPFHPFCKCCVIPVVNW